MPRIPESQKQDRLQRVVLLLERHPDGLTEREIAHLLNYEQRTTNNYLHDLEIQGAVYKEDGGLWFTLPSQKIVLRSFPLSPEQAMVLYLAARLFVKQSDQRIEAAELVLEKLADVLSSDMGLEKAIYEAARELAQRPKAPGYEDVFRVVMQGYIYRRRLMLQYHPYGGQPFTTTFAPYLLEPSAIGFSTYAIGHSSLVNALRTYKIERIQSAQLTREEYEIPPDFPGLDLLRNAWSIFYGDEVVRVVLRFHPDVARRVRETHWHPSQQLEPDEELPDCLRLAIQVASTTDLLPWIRSWGANCEVLEPPSLRKAQQRELRQLCQVYGIQSGAAMTPIETLWAKTDRKTGELHLLIYHLIDVAMVALTMWRMSLLPGLQDQLMRSLGLDTESAGRLLAFWIGLHDIGKASPPFQRKHEPAVSLLEQAGLRFPMSGARDARHGQVAAVILPPYLQHYCGLHPQEAKQVAHALGGHHGSWPTIKELQSADSEVNRGGSEWDEARDTLVEHLHAVLDPPVVQAIPSSIEQWNALLVLMSGFTSVADWLGSMEGYFAFEEELIPLDDYASRSAQQADRVLFEQGWMARRTIEDSRSFQDLFAFAPNAMQQTVAAQIGTDQPALAILEAPTGTGKTEAAFFLADNWLQANRGQGIYIAMPTQATSNQMFERFRAFLQTRYPEDLINLHLLHGGARWIDNYQSLQLNTVYEEEDGESGRIAALQWFMAAKRGLLAPFAVGTVDQVLLSVLLIKHFFVRFFGISHKIVIFDEVHAYDTYMSTLFCRLLAWLRQLNTSVIILSATLPARTKRELINAYAGAAPENVDSAYPSLTLASSSPLQTISLPTPSERKITLEWIGPGPQDIVACLQQELEEGGCAAVICNRVKRAQEVYQALQAAQIVPDEHLTLFHARFPFAWRQTIEEKVVTTFGKANNQRPYQSVVVATQVIEQSLDLDFDLIITDLAPVDLILQRAGRLHRHDRTGRPATLSAPRMVLASPEVHDGIPSFGHDVYIYDQYVLLVTYLCLFERPELRLPTDTVPLIETVYSEEIPFDDLPEAIQQELVGAYQDMQKSRHESEFHARQSLVVEPSSKRLLRQPNPALREDAPDIHQAYRALTREAGPSLSLVCLFETEDGLALDPAGRQIIRLDGSLTDEHIKQLLKNAVSVRHGWVIKALAEQPVPDEWQRIPGLRDCRRAVFVKGSYQVPGTKYVLYLDRQFGLSVE